MIAGNSERSAGGNTFKGNKPADLINETKSSVAAKNNTWDHQTASEVLSNDVRGPAEVEPIAQPQQMSGEQKK